MTQSQELRNKRAKYYGIQAIRYEMLKAMRKREVVLMSKSDNSKCIRGLTISTEKFLRYILREYNTSWKDDNVYVSCAKYNFIPQFSYNLKERSKDTRHWFNNKAQNEIIEYDLLLDFDCDNPHEFKKMHKEVYDFIRLLYYYDIEFNINPSGNNFQIVIDGSILPTSTPNTIKSITEQFKKRFELNYLDLTGIGNYDKIRKCEYSLVNDRVILPFNNFTMFKNYHPKFIDSNYVLKNINLLKRGLCKFNNMYSLQEKRIKFHTFLEMEMITI